MLNHGCLGFGLDDVSAELDQLRKFIDFSLKYQECKDHRRIADDFCVLAERYRLKIIVAVRCNKNINHPAKDVIQALNFLASKVDRLNERNGWKIDCCEE